MMSAVTWTDKAQVAIFAAQLAILVLAAGIAWFQAGEARRLRRQQIRPFVVVDFDVQARNTEIFLEVTNLGASLARDVRIEIEPALESSEDIDVASLKMLKDGIATLAPGKAYRTLFDMGFKRVKAGLCMTFSATVTYTDEDGSDPPFEEVLLLDLEQYMNIRFLKKREVHDLHKELEAIRKVMEGWGWPLGQGLISITPDEARREEERILAELDDRKRERDGTVDDNP